jgi:membrane-associated protein
VHFLYSSPNLQFLQEQKPNNKSKMLHDLLQFLDPQKIITAFGALGVILIIFAESGLLIGFFLPGDSLLFTAGLLASQDLMPIVPLTVGVFVAAVLGDSFGYWFGRKIGPALFTKEDSRLFKKRYVLETQAFYEKHGRKTIILARFMPIIRTFAPIVAGVANMKYQTFISYNVIGGFFWSVGVTLAGYFLGKSIPNADAYLTPIILLIVLTSFIPAIVHMFRRKKLKNVVQ